MALNQDDFRKAFGVNTHLADARRTTFARRAPNHFWGLVFTGLFIAACLAVFAFRLATRSAFEREGEQEVRGISDVVSVHRNDYGIVHITGRTDNDVYFGIGYAHAQDRLWQMDFLRRVGRGRLSEMFGRRTLEQDIFLRAMRFDSISSALARHISPDSRAVLQAYTDGVNEYLTTHEGRIAAEFDALEYQLEPWRVEDCLLVLRLWAWELNSTFTADLVLTAIADTIGRERALHLLPPPGNDPYFAPCVLDSLLPARPTARVTKALPAIDSLRTDSLQQRTTTGTLSRLGKSSMGNTDKNVRATKNSIRFLSENRPNAFGGTDIPVFEPLSGKYYTDKNVYATADGQMRNILTLAQSVRSVANMSGSSLGSNAWAVRPSSFFHPEQDSLGHHFPVKYRHGAILAADAHLALTLPARWYEAHLSSPTLNVLGHTLPGLPFVIVGRNDRLAWSLVNAMVDDTDFFAEKLDSTDLRRYFAADSLGGRISLPFRIVTDTIKVKDSSDAVVETRYAGRSSIMSDLPDGMKNFPGLQNAIPWRSRLQSPQILNRIADSTNTATQKAFQALTRRECLTFQWTGQQMSDEALTLLRLAKARSWDDVLSAGSTFATPAVNCIVASSDGEVGVVPFGIVPRRLPGAHPNFVRKGWEPNEAWQGFARLSDVGQMLNPPSGRVIAANNPIMRNASVNGSPLHLSLLWDVPSRASRIGEFLQEFEHYSMTGMGIMQTDVVSHYAQMLVPYMTQAFTTPTTSTLQATSVQSLSPKSQALTRTERNALQLMASWNGALESTSAVASIYSAFLERYAYNTLADDLGDGLYRQYVATTRLPLRALLSLTERYKPDDSLSVTWFDKRETPERESRDDIIRQSFLEAVALVQKQMNTPTDIDSIAAWNYGRLHTLSMRHILTNGAELTHLSLRGVVNGQTVQYGGDATTISSGEWSFNRPFEAAVGASMRFVCDMSDTLAYMILPSGNTGEIMTRNYSDQTQLWLGGGLLPVPVSREPHTAFHKVLRLIPKRQ